MSFVLRRMIRILLGALLGLGVLNTVEVRTAAAAHTAEIFVVNSSDSIMAYAPDKSGDVAPDWVMGLQLTPQGIALDSTGRLSVTNHWIDSVSVFAPGANGTAAPVATIRGSKTELESPTGIAVDSKGKIYVVNGGDLYSADGPRRVDIYAADANGNVAPIAAIKGPHTRLEVPTAVAVDPSGKIYVVDNVGDEPRVVIYRADSNGDVPPVTTISGDKTGLVMPNGVAVDASGKIYVTNDGSEFGRDADSVTVYPANARGNIAPIATISSDHIHEPRGIAVDSSGKIYVTNNFDTQKIAVFPAGADGTLDPIASIQGSQTELEEEIEGVTVSPTGAIYAASCPLSQSGKITEYAPNSDGDVKPIATITDRVETKLNSPRSIALDSTGQIYVANIESVTVYPSGTHGNVPPLFTITGPFAQFINAPSGIALDSEKNIYLVNQAIGTYVNGYASIFAPGSHDNTRPRAIVSFATKHVPRAIAVDRRDDLFVAVTGNGSKDPGSIFVYPPDSHGVAQTVATLQGVDANGIALDPTGRIYVANPGASPSDEGSVDIYPGLVSEGHRPGEPAQISLLSLPGYPNVRPLASIAGVQTRLAHPQAIALDANGRIYVLNQDQYQHPGQRGDSGSITVYPPLASMADSKLDEKPLAIIAGPNTQLDMHPAGIAVWDPPVR